MRVIISVMDAEVTKDKGPEHREEIFGGVKVLLLGDLLMAPGVVWAQPLLILRFPAPTALRSGVKASNGGSAGRRLNGNLFLLK